MILSYKLCINILLEPVKIDTERTQSKDKTGIIFLFISVKKFKWSFSVVLFYVKLCTK